MSETEQTYAYVVVNQDGATTHYASDKAGWTEDQAQARANQANAEAARLELEVRYEVARKAWPLGSDKKAPNADDEKGGAE